MRKDVLAAVIGTIYLLVYTVLFHTGAPMPLIGTMFLVSPFVVVWMAYTIIKHGRYEGKELEKDEEWGYCDKDKKDFEHSMF